MTRVKGGTVTRARRKKVLKNAKGYFGSKHRLYKTAQEQLFHSGEYAYRDRKKNKSNFRKLWITRINAACRINDISYSKFIDGLNKAGIEINRKMLSELAISAPEEFTKIVNMAKDALNGKVAPKAEKATDKSVEVKSVKEDKAANSESSSLNSKTVAELKEMAKEKGIEGYTSMKKAELIDALK
jgi:large subunit ribosomal protein L20